MRFAHLLAVCFIISPAFLALLVPGCASTGGGADHPPYELRTIRGADWIDGREGYRPELPGFMLDGDIGTIAVRATHPGAPDRLVLLIRTSPGQRPNLEGFTFSTSVRTFSTSPFSPSATVEVREIGTSRTAGRVPVHAYFDFQIEGEYVRVTFLPSSTELMTEECQVSWVDWYRR